MSDKLPLMKAKEITKIGLPSPTHTTTDNKA